MKKIVLLGFLLFLLGCNTATEKVSTRPTIAPTEIPPIGVSFATKPPDFVPVAQVTSTPLPPPTLTPVPTPTSYEVVAGDTLWGIANKTGSSFEQLIEINPSLNPDQLSLGDTLLVPPPPTPIYQDGINPSYNTTVELEILSAEIYQTPVESYWVFANIQNQSATAVQNSQLTFYILDDAGETIDTVQGWIQPSILLPQERGTVAVQVNQLPRTPDSVVSEITTASAVWDMANRVRQYDVSIPTRSNQNGVWHIASEITAPNFLTTDVTAYITLYNSQGAIIGFQQLPVADQLGADEIISLETTVLPLQSAVQEIQLLVYGTK